MNDMENQPVEMCPELQPKFQEIVEKTHLPDMIPHMFKKLNSEEKHALVGSGETDVASYASAGEVYRAIHGGSPAEAIVKAAAKLKLIDGETRAELLREIYRVEGHRGSSAVPYLDVAPEHAEIELKNAIAENRLVIFEGSGIHCLIWEGRHIDNEWSKNPRAWEFMWELVLAASRGRAVDKFSFGPETRPLKERLQGLKRALSKSPDIEELSKPLISLICQPDKESYRLSLPSDQVWLRRLNGDRWEYEFEDIPSLNKIIEAERSKLRRELRHNTRGET